MKKTLLLLASAALLLVGCAKEKFAEPSDGGLTKATFSVSVDNGVPTKAFADGDGAGAYVNRCIMEIYFQDELYKRMVEPAVNGVATFANVPVVAGKEYQILFWADCGGTEKSDLYYMTTSLKAVTVAKTAFIDALEAGDNDNLDAFYFAGNYTVPQNQTQPFAVTLKRPFAQLNVITTDVAEGKTVTSQDLLPEKVSVSYKADNILNVATGETSRSETEADYTFTYEAPVYGVWSDTKSELTLSMDYILASTDKSAIDVTFKTKNGSTEVMSHSLTNLPYQRNYRTNVKGDLLTTGGSWTATIDADWATPNYDVPFYVASSIVDAQSYISSQNTEQAKAVDLSKAEIKQSDVNQEDGTIHFILKTTSPQDLVNFTLPAIPAGIEAEGWTIEYQEGYPTENVGVNAPEGTKVKILAPTSHVSVTGTRYAEIEASTGDNTLVIPQGVTVNSLIVRQGAVEIHGSVSALEVAPAEGAKVCFRACEGLSAAVFAKIYSTEAPVCNYLDPMYAYEQVGEKYNIYKLPVVAMIGEKEYPSIAAALAAVPADNTELVTIKVMSDVVLKKADALTVNKNNVVLDGQDHTIALDENDSELAPYLVDGSSKKYGSFQMIKVSGNDVVLKNMTLDSKNYRGASLATTWGGKNASYENIIYKGLGSGHYYGYAASDGILKFTNCTFETHGYAIHTAESSTVLEVSDCEIHGWVSYGDKTKSATFTNTHFYSTTDQYNGVIATIRPYCATTITNCTFSKEYLVKYKFDGLTVRKNVVVSLNGCSVEEGDLCDIANITCPDDPWIDGGVIAIDATGNANDGFTAGTFMAKQASDIKVAGLNEAVPVEGKEYVFTIAPKQLDENTVAVLGATEYSSFEAAMQAALEAKGGTITLVKDVTLAKGWDHGANIGDNRDKYSFVLNLNGKTIFRGPNNYHISLCDNDWTVIDETGEGTINKASDGTSNLTLWCANGHDPFFSKMAKFETCPVFILNGGTYIGGTFGVDFQAGGSGDGHMAICKFLLNKATVKNMRILNGQGEIKDGTFSGKITLSVDDTKYTQFGITLDQFTTTISGGNFTLDQSEPFVFQSYFPQTNLRIIGGTFNFNPSVNYSACIPAGYTSHDNGNGTWTVVAAN